MSNLFKRHSSEVKSQKDILDLLIMFEPMRCKPDLNNEKIKRLRKTGKSYSKFFEKTLDRLDYLSVSPVQRETLKRYLESVR